MDLKLNDSEVMQILVWIDDSLGYDLEPLEKITLINILHKINNNIAYKHHNAIDDYGILIRETYLED